MKAKSNFPEWIVNVADKNQASIHKESNEYFEKVKELYPHFCCAYIDIPKNVDLGVLKSHDPSKVSNYFQKDSPIEFIVFNIYHFICFTFCTILCC